jgi:hypothetical protein
MRLRQVLVVCAALALSLAVALPASANNKPTTGTRISLFAPPLTFPANTPFFIEGGSGCDTTIGDSPSTCMHASTHFDLYLDGVLQPSTVDVDNTPTFKLKRYLTNYPAGLPAGVHTFVGDFYVNGTLLLTTGTVAITFT